MYEGYHSPRKIISRYHQYWPLDTRRRQCHEWRKLDWPTQYQFIAHCRRRYFIPIAFTGGPLSPLERMRNSWIPIKRILYRHYQLISSLKITNDDDIYDQWDGEIILKAFYTRRRYDTEIMLLDSLLSIRCLHHDFAMSDELMPMVMMPWSHLKPGLLPSWRALYLYYLFHRLNKVILICWIK